MHLHIRRRCRDFAPITAAVLLSMAAPAVAADDVPNLVGAWVGHAIGGVVQGKLGHLDPSEAPMHLDPAKEWTVTIESQDGRGFIGTWSSSANSEVLIGVIRSDNKTLYMVDEDSYFDVILLDENRMESCARETQQGSMVAACHILERKAQ